MILEQRTYDFQPGTLSEFFRLYEDTGAGDLQRRILGNLVGYYVTEIGPLNQTVHLWRYASFDDRVQRRAKLLSKASWREFLFMVTPLIQHQESKIILPRPFSPDGARKP